MCKLLYVLLKSKGLKNIQECYSINISDVIDVDIEIPSKNILFSSTAITRGNRLLLVLFIKRKKP